MTERSKEICEKLLTSGENVLVC